MPTPNIEIVQEVNHRFISDQRTTDQLPAPDEHGKIRQVLIFNESGHLTEIVYRPTEGGNTHQRVSVRY